jgi:hypothetical protein
MSVQLLRESKKTGRASFGQAFSQQLSRVPMLQI